MSQQNLTTELTTFMLVIITSILICSLPIINSLTIDMVRRDSFDFDLFPKNLSDFQKNRIFTQLSHSRAHRLSGQHSDVSKSINDPVLIDTIQPPIKQFMNSLFAVSLAIGSRPYETYLAIDTGSDVTWVQCQGCKNGELNCFEIKNGPFNQTASSSYHKIRFDDRLCQPRIPHGNDCKFEANYGSGNVEGVRALESLHFHSTNRNRQVTISNMLLGCAKVVQNWSLGRRNDGPNNVVSGVFGLAIGYTRNENSFMELTQNFTKMKFSYCLPSWSASKSKSIPLSFGDDVPRLHHSARSTPMDNSMYYLNVSDISVGGQRLHLNPNIFKRREDGRGGFAIDSGSGMSILVYSAYHRVREALAANLTSQGKRKVDPPLGYRKYFCYKYPLSVKKPPSLTYHLENNADIEVRFEDLFMKEKFEDINRSLACLTFSYVDVDGVTNLLGAAHQANYRFVYDLDHKTLHFQRDRC